MTRPPLAPHSRFAQRIRRRFEAQLPLLPAGLPTTSGSDTAAALRITRALVLERLLCLDCEQGAPLLQVTTAMTQLAEFAVNQAQDEVLQALDKSHGMPLGSQGQRAQMWVVGMGKLGARELNVSSDIDLIYRAGDA